MKKPVFVTSLVILLLLTVASVAIGWLCYTASGLQFALMQLNHIPGVRLSVEGVQGKLAGPLSIDHIRIDHERVAIDLDKVNIEFTPAALISGLISIDSLTAEKIKVHVKPFHNKTSDHPIYFLPHFLRISAEQVVIQNASYQQDNKEIIGDAHLQGSVALSRNRLKINELMLLAQQIDTRGDLVLQAGPVLTLNATLNAKYHLSSGVIFSGALNISGPVTGFSSQLNINAQLVQPQRATIKSLLKWPDNQWNLQGDLAAEVLQLDAWWKRPAFSLKAVAMQFSVSKNGMRNAGQLVIPEFSSTPLKIDAQAFYADQVLTLQSAKVSAINTPTQISAQGTINFQEKNSPIIDLQSRWTDLRWPIHAAKSSALITSTQGLFKISGQSTYQYELAGQISAPYWKDGLVSIRGKINPNLLTVSRYEASGSQGRLAGDASLQLGGLREWHLGIEGNKLDASAIDARWPSDINIKATVQGRGFNRQAEFDMQVQQLNGVLRRQPVQGSGRLQHLTNRWNTQKIHLSWGAARLSAEGSVAKSDTGSTHDLHWALEVPALKLLDDQLDGDLSMKGHLSGAMHAPQMSLQLQTKRFGYEGLNVQKLNVSTSIDMSDQTDSKLELNFDTMSLKQASLNKIKMTGEGHLRKHTLTLQGMINIPSVTAPMPLELQLQGGYSAKNWQGILSTLKVGVAQLEKQSAVMLSAHHAQFNEFCLKAGSGHLCADGQWQRDEMGHNQWSADAQLQSLPIALQNSALINGAHLQAKLNGQLTLKALPNMPWQGTASLQMQEAGIHYRGVSGREEVLPIKLGELHVQADDKVIESSGELRISEQTVTTLNASLDRSAGRMLFEHPLSGVMTLSSSDAKLIPVFVPEVDRANGTLAAALQLSGTAAVPRMTGIVRLLQGELDFYRLNLALRNINFDAQVDTDRFSFTGKANTGEGELNGNGHLQWQDAKLLGQLQLKGDRVLIADLPEYRVFASPDLQFEFKDKQVNVTGSVLIPEARLQPREIKSAVQISADTRYKNEEVLESKPTGWLIDSQTRIQLGDRVSVDALGLTGRLSGEVVTRLRTNDKAEGTGELNVNEGNYEIYGQKLTIKRGQLIYDNTLLSDPALNIQAERTIDTTTVGVNVRGLLREPRFQFYSNPAMSQSQALSYLLVGKPIDELQSTEAAKVGSASNTLAIQGGGYLASQVGRRIGLEQVDMQTDANNQSSLVLGKFLSPRLFVSYGISLTQAINTLKIRYTLGQHWSLKSELGAAKGADLEFKIDR